MAGCGIRGDASGRGVLNGGFPTMFGSRKMVQLESVWLIALTFGMVLCAG